MKCPICGKEVELQNKQVGTDASGTPVFHEYAVCRDCKKQWDLDKQRAKKRAEKQTHPRGRKPEPRKNLLLRHRNQFPKKGRFKTQLQLKNLSEIRQNDQWIRLTKKMQFLLRKKTVPMRKKQFPKTHLQKQ